jgi:crossover junction endodeoxyribonuclease RusA
LTVSVTLPYPPTALRPNAGNQGNWYKRSSAKKSYKEECYLLALATKDRPEQVGFYHTKITFCPPDNRSRDLDNALASFKAGIDGTMEAWGMNDKFLRPITLDFGPVTKGGSVIFSIEDAIRELMG